MAQLSYYHCEESPVGQTRLVYPYRTESRAFYPFVEDGGQNLQDIVDFRLDGDSWGAGTDWDANDYFDSLGRRWDRGVVFSQKAHQIDIPDNPQFSFSHGMTVLAWFRHDLMRAIAIDL